MNLLRVFKHIYRGVLLSTALLFAQFAAAQAPALATDAQGYAPAETCIGCHTAQAAAWKHSDHDWAMLPANKSSVLGNFKDAQFKDGKVQARFFKKGEKFFVNTEGADGKPGDFEIIYTFGYKPLQQYLVAFPGGRLQSLTIAWDSRPKAEGGQRWFSMYPGQHFAPTDPLHWTGRYQNWNAMCADCHSSNLLKGYDDKTDTFTTTWHEQNVGCQACHGPGQAHVDWAGKEKAAGEAKPAQASYTPAEVGLKVDYKAMGSKGMVDQCAYCHSRRQSLNVGQQPDKPIFDSVLPSTLRPDLYHADGQMQGEVYVHGSFTQSKMYAAGVACTDCHDPHTTKVKIEGNGLCQQCHNPTPPARFPSLQAKNYESPEHHHHQAGSPGAQCVNCHMPAQTYMVVDPRRDHSFRLPRPDLDAQTDSPDACTACHKDKEPAWAVKAIDGWFGTPQRPPHYGLALHAGRTGQADALPQLSALISDLGKPAIVRATAAEQLASMGEPALPSLAQALKDDNAMVRAYAASGFTRQKPVERVKHLLPLLHDDNLAVRDEALRALVGISLVALPEAEREPYKAALADYERRLRGNADLPGNRLNLAVLLERDGRQQEALEQYRQALKLDPYFAPARVNLVTLANSMLRQDEAEQVLRDGVALKDMPVTDHGNIAYMLALLLVERNKMDEALPLLETAAKELPQNARIRYNQGLLLLQMHRRVEALAALKAGLEQAPDDADLLYAMVYLHGSAGLQQEAIKYVRLLEKAAPQDERLPDLKRQLGLL